MKTRKRETVVKGVLLSLFLGFSFFSGLDDFSLIAACASQRGGFFAQTFTLPAMTSDLITSDLLTSEGADSLGMLEPLETAATPASCGEAYQTADALSFSQDVTLRGALGLSSCRSVQLWGNFYVGSGKIKPKETGLKIDNDLTGAMIGVNFGLGGAFLVSGYYNYDNGEMTFPTDAFDTTTHLGGLGLRYQTNGFYFTLLGNYGRDAHTLSESTENGRSLDFDGWQAAGFFESGFNFPTAGGLFELKPYANFQYNYLSRDRFDRAGFTTLGGGVANDAFYQTLGSRINMGLGIFDLQGRLAWIHQYLENAPIQNLWFGRAPGTITPTRVYYEGNAGRDFFWGGVGGKISLFNAISVTLDYDCLINKYQTTHIGSVGLLWSF